MITYDLKGKVALVSGAARGIGLETAGVLGKAGASVVITDILKEAGAAAVQTLNADGCEARFVEADARSEDDWKRAVDACCDAFGNIDVLVNNAGVEAAEPITECTLETWQWMQSINCDGVFLGTKTAINAMKPGGRSGRGGSIINLSSVAGLVGFPGFSAYCASKGSVRMFTKAVAVECGRMGHNVRVNSVHPGIVDTQMGQALSPQMVKIGFAPDEKTAYDAFVGAHPIGRLGEVMDVANAILFLASDASSWVTGSELVVDGGLTAY